MEKPRSEKKGLGSVSITALPHAKRLEKKKSELDDALRSLWSAIDSISSQIENSSQVVGDIIQNYYTTGGGDTDLTEVWDAINANYADITTNFNDITANFNSISDIEGDIIDIEAAQYTVSAGDAIRLDNVGDDREINLEYDTDDFELVGNKLTFKGSVDPTDWLVICT